MLEDGTLGDAQGGGNVTDAGVVVVDSLGVLDTLSQAVLARRAATAGR